MPRMVITDKLWSELKPMLPPAKGRWGKDDRLFLEAVCWLIRTGCPWRDLPPEFGSWKTVYNRFNRWAKKGYLDDILTIFKKRWRSHEPHDRRFSCSTSSAR